MNEMVDTSQPISNICFQQVGILQEFCRLTGCFFTFFPESLCIGRGKGKTWAEGCEIQDLWRQRTGQKSQDGEMGESKKRW